jgi:hypothetical protein
MAGLWPVGVRKSLRELFSISQFGAELWELAQNIFCTFSLFLPGNFRGTFFVGFITYKTLGIQLCMYKPNFSPFGWLGAEINAPEPGWVGPKIGFFQIPTG